MIWECSCGRCGTAKYFFVVNKYTCPLCNSLLNARDEFSLVFWGKHDNQFVDFDESFLHPSRKAVLEAIKVIQPCSDKMISLYLNKTINRVTNRRGELHNCSIPFILQGELMFDSESKRWVKTWIINKVLDVERELEVKQCLV